MRINIDCECVLLAEALRLFCKDFSCARAECDFIISDRRIKASKPVFIISKDSPHISLPFTKDALFESLQDFYSAIQVPMATIKPKETKDDLESAINELCDKFKADLIAILRQVR
ncbi:ornithine carbamoyltransferase [Campylobacter sp. 19-13652]|uniref:ornithine carbamoyltransferase n=1 Tax=Campylobacter sp. 19-13652 TaxID=2840180 RepID=UPI001C786C43|nr:ornithine carbamoyltransferase [Campylobacter sp. 19-13652]BCX79836.1 hypothetical protein LBC_12980 [Campylobacter sp. 19-13652]